MTQHRHAYVIRSRLGGTDGAKQPPAPRTPLAQPLAARPAPMASIAPKASNAPITSITAVVADPLVRIMMRADRVDPPQLEAFLRGVAQRLDRSRRRPADILGD